MLMLATAIHLLGVAYAYLVTLTFDFLTLQDVKMSYEQSGI